MRLATTLAICENKAIQVKNIRINDEKPGLTYEDTIYLEILKQISNAEVNGIKEGSTEYTFSPKIIRKAPLISFKYPSLLTVLLPYLFILYYNEDMNIGLLGPTNSENKLSADYFKNIICPMFSKIGLNFKIEITKRGYDKDQGKIILHIKKSSKIKNFELLEKGDLEHITIDIHSYGHKEIINEYILEGIKNTLNPKEIKVNEFLNTFVENRDKNKGFGADVIIRYENTLMGTNLSSSKKQPTQLGKELADKLISLYERETPLDLNCTNMILPILCKENKNFNMIVPKKDTRINDCLYICELFYNTKYNLEEREKDYLLKSK